MGDGTVLLRVWLGLGAPGELRLPGLVELSSSSSSSSYAGAACGDSLCKLIRIHVLLIAVLSILIVVDIDFRLLGG